MFIGYGYGYPRSMQFGGVSSPALTAWNAFNSRATTDGATAAEAAVNACLFTRFAAIFNF
jgi:hypothetical protein